MVGWRSSKGVIVPSPSILHASFYVFLILQAQDSHEKVFILTHIPLYSPAAGNRTLAWDYEEVYNLFLEMKSDSKFISRLWNYLKSFLVSLLVYMVTLLQLYLTVIY